jgi:DNA processing protein
MKKEELSYWLALNKAPRLGPRTLFQLLQQVPKISDLFAQQRTFYDLFRLHATTSAYLVDPNWQAVEQDLQWLEQSKLHKIITIACPEYPKLLLETPSPPPLLYIKGNASLLNNHAIAIVGSRKPSPEGKEIAFDLAKNLGLAAITVTSGLAQGIDTAAHLGALESYNTIAVIGTGIDITYPRANQKLADQIQEQGLIISELSLGSQPLPENFPRRNRIISGLSLGTVIVEANLQSGSLITANCAVEQGREVFAIPGSIRNPRTKGCHQLLKNGAGLVTCAEDILIELGLDPPKLPHQSISSGNSEHFKLEEAHLKLLECVGYEPAKIDILVERSNFPVKLITAMLFDLELAGYVCSTFSGYRRVA